jgi:putative ABC transport system ATP-binding protein
VAFVTIQNVSKTYQEARGGAPVCVLSNVTATLEEGEFVCLMGPSGSGKSTMLTIVGAMNHPTAGKLMVDGIDVYALNDERRADFRREYIGFVFQQHHLMPYLNTLENTMLPLAASRISAREKKQRALRVLERVGLADKAARLPNQLSGGEQGRVAIARALVNDPPLILADEPTGTLDTRTGNEIMGIFQQLNSQGQTIFMVTHNYENAALAHRVLQIRDGRLAGEEVHVLYQPEPAQPQPALQA